MARGSIQRKSAKPRSAKRRSRSFGPIKRLGAWTIDGAGLSAFTRGMIDLLAGRPASGRFIAPHSASRQRAAPYGSADYRGGRTSAIILSVSSASRFAVVLVRPDSPENIGLAARGMANTGFADLRLVGLDRLEAPAWRTAIHAEPIIEGARFYASLAEAVADRDLVLGSTARVRHDFPLVPLADAVARVEEYPPSVRVGLVFGNERTGLTQEELGLANIRFH